MINQFQRLIALIGEEGYQRLKESAVIVFGIGGVGSSAAETLVRAGIGRIDIVDNDKVDITNINRQLIALHSTVGRDKVEVMKERMLDINPDVKVNTFRIFYNDETCQHINLCDYDYIIDAIDTVTSKLLLIRKAKEENIRIISSMGTGNKFNPEMLEIADIRNTTHCPLARVMRKELSNSGITELKVIFSKESPRVPFFKESDADNRGRHIAGSTSFVPPVAGMMMAAEVIKHLLNLNE